jgi:5-methylcytosine-specific restriction endonuclease McrA
MACQAYGYFGMPSFDAGYWPPLHRVAAADVISHTRATRRCARGKRGIMLESLVLNAAAIPVSIVPWQRAMRLFLAEKAVVLAEYEDTLIRSAQLVLRAPAVIQCVKTQYMPKDFVKTLPFSRRNVYVRDRGHCMYSGKRVTLANFTFDHVIPRCRGGKSEWTNVVVCCIACNARKGGRIPSRAGMTLIRHPFAPRLDKAAPARLVSRIASEIPHESWEDYIYWNLILDE